MARNLCPAVHLNDEQRSKIDDVVILILRRRGHVRLRDILGDVELNRVLLTMPDKKPDYRFVSESLQRLKWAGKAELIRQRWQARPI